MRLYEPSNILRSSNRISELWEKSIKKYKKVQEWTKSLSGLSPLWAKNRKFMARSVIKGYQVLLTGAKKILDGDTEKRKEKEIAALELLNFTDYADLILAQEDTVCFHIIEEVKTKLINTEMQDQRG